MYDNYLAEERAASLRQSAQELRLARQVAAAHRWSRIAQWAEGRARRANSRLS
jgi:hypothetical protein